MSTPAGPGGFPGQTQPQQPQQSQQPAQSPYPQQGYVDPQVHGAYAPQGGQGGGPGVGERASHMADSVARHVKTPETKEFFKTSEFIVWGLTVLGILIAAAVVTEGEGHDFPANQAWLYVTIASAAYIISRGIAKAGTRRGYGDAPFDRGGSDGAPFQRGGGY
jgi:hypothetical protein